MERCVQLIVFDEQIVGEEAAAVCFKAPPKSSTYGVVIKIGHYRESLNI